MNPYAIPDTTSSIENEALNAGADPKDLQAAKSQLGKAEYIGYCESFVEAATGSGNQGATADQAFSNQKNAISDPSLKGAKPGDEVYFADPSNPAGHVGIMDTGDNFVSATDNGVQENNLNSWEHETGQTPLGYVPQGTPKPTNPYLIAQDSQTQPSNPYAVTKGEQ